MKITFNADNKDVNCELTLIQEVIPEIRGDVDRDGNVNIADVTTLIDYLLSGQTAPATADCDKDGNVNIADVTALIDYLLSGDATGVNLDMADCDLDGEINIADVTSLIDYLLAGEWTE